MCHHRFSRQPTRQRSQHRAKCTCQTTKDKSRPQGSAQCSSAREQQARFDRSTDRRTLHCWQLVTMGRSWNRLNFLAVLCSVLAAKVVHDGELRHNSDGLRLAPGTHALTELKFWTRWQRVLCLWLLGCVLRHPPRALGNPEAHRLCLALASRATWYLRRHGQPCTVLLLGLSQAPLRSR